MNISKITLGTAQLGFDYGISNKKGKPTDDQSYRILQTALDNGITSFDTAPVYGNSENLIGNFLKNKYSQPIHKMLLTSTNFPANFVWLEQEEDKVINPYKRLPPVFDDWTEVEIENSISDIEDINDGGAALTAYGKLQYQIWPKLKLNK